MDQIGLKVLYTVVKDLDKTSKGSPGTRVLVSWEHWIIGSTRCKCFHTGFINLHSVQ